MTKRSRLVLTLVVVLLMALLVTACDTVPLPVPTAVPAAEPDAPAKAQPGVPNPASVYCQEQGGTLEIRTAADGGQTGYCIFPDGSECEEWAFFRGECAPGASAATLWFRPRQPPFRPHQALLRPPPTT